MTPDFPVTTGSAQGLPFIAASGAIFALSFVICLLIVLTRSRHIGLTTRNGDMTAPQAAHSTPTPRIGGVAIFLSILLVFGTFGGELNAPRTAFMLSVLPVFLAGLAEDLGMGVGPRERLVAAVVSGGLAAAGLGIWVTGLNLPSIDNLFAFWPVAIAFTLLCSAGFSHAFNLIDGINGFAAATGIAIAVALSIIAVRADAPGIAQVCLLLVPALLGFLVLNWPFGTIFLGDAGAYSLGHVFAWLAILIAAQSPDVAAFGLALVLFWPVADTLHAIYRRRRSGRPSYLPDRMHFHHLVMRTIEIRFGLRQQRVRSNPMAAAAMLPFAVTPMAFGVILWNDPVLAPLTFAGFTILFIVTYSRLLVYARRSARRDAANSQLRGLSRAC